MKNTTNNQKGLTLIEVLISMVILSIIMLSLFSYFINAAKYNSATSDNLKTTNIARDVQNQFKVTDSKKTDIKNLLSQYRSWVTTYPASSYPNLNLKQDITVTSSGDLQLLINDPNYIVIAFLNPIPISDMQTPLYKLHVQVNKNEKVLSETYTYLQY